jgi:UDP-apiose/xylose synthase
LNVRIAILGAGGFIGSHLIEHLVERGEHEVVGVDLCRKKLSQLDESAFTFHQADVGTDDDLLDEVVRCADLVVDLVAHANPSFYVTSPLEVFELNFMTNLKIARFCIRHGTRLLQYSSAEVYGKSQDGGLNSEDETDSVLGPVGKQRWIYAASKSLLERVLHAHGLRGDLTYTIVRPFNFIGSRLDYLVPRGSVGGPRVFAHFMSALLSGGAMHLVDGGLVHRTFLHIADANTAFQALLDHPDETRNEIFNIGNPDSEIQIRELAELMLDIYEELTGEVPRCRLVEVKGDRFYGEGYEDADRRRPDIRKLRALGWKPQHDLRSTFADAMASYLEFPESASPRALARRDRDRAVGSG